MAVNSRFCHDYVAEANNRLAEWFKRLEQLSSSIRAFDECLGIFDAYVGTPFSDSQWYLTAFYPAAGSFEDGERGAKCAVFLSTADGASVAPTDTVARASGT